MAGGSTTFRWILQMHKDVPKAAKFYSEGLDFSINVCTLRWAELQSGPLKLALLHSPSLMHKFSNLENMNRIIARLEIHVLAYMKVFSISKLYGFVLNTPTRVLISEAVMNDVEVIL